MNFLNNVTNVIEWEAIIFLAEGFVLFYIAGLVKDKLHPSFKLSEELVLKDNLAMALPMAGYWAGITIVISAVISSPTAGRIGIMMPSIFSDLIETFLWGSFAIVLLNIVFYVNDKLFLSRFSNLKEIIEDRNVGVGAVVMGAYFSSALLIRGLILTPNLETAYLDILFFVLYFIAGQAALFLFFKLYISIAGYDVMKELEDDNAACGVAVGLALIAISFIISYPLQSTLNILTLTAYFINGSVLLIVTRFLADKVILNKSLLSHEISKDRNMGAAIIEGALAISAAVLITSSFSF